MVCLDQGKRFTQNIGILGKSRQAVNGKAVSPARAPAGYDGIFTQN